MAVLKQVTNKHSHSNHTVKDDERTVMAGPISFTNLTANGSISIIGDLTVTSNLDIGGASAIVRLI